MDEIDIASLIGTSCQDEAALVPGPADRLAAALDFADPPFHAGARLPHAWHWLYFHSSPKASALGSDGRGAAGELVPAFEGLNRMWAGGAFAFAHALKIGERVRRHSTIISIEEKIGRSGRLVVATIEHTLSDSLGHAITERHDLVFRERKPQSAAGPGERATATPGWQRTLTPEEVLLFRFSALTYNSHRIHYDWPYTTKVEGYPGLLVHGPLTAMLLLDSIRRNVPGDTLKGFQYRAVRPLFCGNPMTVCGALSPGGATVDVWAQDHDGYVAMRGTGDLG